MDIEKIKEIHSQGFNCAQVVYSYGAGLLGIDAEIALKAAACFGAGMRMAGTCGCVTGALMAIGGKYGNCVPNDLEAKNLSAEKAVEYEKAFLEKYGSLECRELLGCDPTTPDGKAHWQENGLSEKICASLMKYACDYLDKTI